MANIQQIRSLILICLSHQLRPSSHRWTPTTSLHDILEAVCYSLWPLLSPLLILFLGTRLINPRLFWKDQQHEFPILASLARDVLTTPATGSGVERLFNSARDICHYRRGSLKPTTIRDLMMFMCTWKFDIESEQLTLVDEYLTAQEIQAAREEKDAHKTGDEFHPISDDEEDAPVTIFPLLRPPTERVPSKRPRTDDREDQET